MSNYPIALLSGLLLVTGCVPVKRYQALEAQHKRLQGQLAREHEEFTQLQGIRYSLESQLQAKTRQVAQAGQAERERLATLTQQYNTLVAEHNQLADNYARLTALFDSTQRQSTELIGDLEARLGASNRTLSSATRAKKPVVKSRRRRRR